MKSHIVKALLVAATLMAGCASSYSSIIKNEDGSYTMTKVAQGFLRVKSTVYHCAAQGPGLSCQEIDTP